MVAVGLACLVHSESKLYSVVRVVCVHLACIACVGLRRRPRTGSMESERDAERDVWSDVERNVGREGHTL